MHGQAKSASGGPAAGAGTPGEPYYNLTPGPAAHLQHRSRGTPACYGALEPPLNVQEQSNHASSAGARPLCRRAVRVAELPSTVTDAASAQAGTDGSDHAFRMTVENSAGRTSTLMAACAQRVQRLSAATHARVLACRIQAASPNPQADASARQAQRALTVPAGWNVAGWGHASAACQPVAVSGVAPPRRPPWYC